MTEKVSTLDVRQRIGDLLNRVALRHDEFIIERKGKSLVVLVPVERWERIREIARRQALDALDPGRGRDLPGKESMALANEAMRWARRRPKTRRR